MSQVEQGDNALYVTHAKQLQKLGIRVWFTVLVFFFAFLFAFLLQTVVSIVVVVFTWVWNAKSTQRRDKNTHTHIIHDLDAWSLNRLPSIWTRLLFSLDYYYIILSIDFRCDFFFVPFCSHCFYRMNMWQNNNERRNNNNERKINSKKKTTKLAAHANWYGRRYNCWFGHVLGQQLECHQNKFE